MLLKNLDETASFVLQKSSVKPKVGIILGSGLAAFADAVKESVAIPYNEVPHFAPPTVEGHPGRLVTGKIGPTSVAVLQGRVHYYEGHTMDQVVYPARMLAKLGITILIITNASGGISPTMKAGDFMLIEDHINLTGTNPLIGSNFDELGPRFPDMSEAYDKKLTQQLEEILQQKKVRYSRGIYCGVSGPSYETPAEVKYLNKIGGGAVGMSTVPEVIAARHMGLRVCGVSCVTNLAAGLSPTPLSHEEVKEAAKNAENTFCEFLTEFVVGLANA